MVMKDKADRARLDAMHWAARRERCPAELKAFLRKKDLAEKAISEIQDFLEKEGYMDISRYACAFARDNFTFNDWGRYRIGRELQAREIPAPQITTALACIPADEYLETLDKLLKGKLARTTAASRVAILHKITTFAVQKGFEPALVRERAEALLHHP
jgi:regulatory protein